MSVDTTMLYLLFHPLPQQPPSLFRAEVPLPTVKAGEFPVREWVHGAKHLPPHPKPIRRCLLVNALGALQRYVMVASKQSYGGGICLLWTPPF